MLESYCLNHDQTFGWFSSATFSWWQWLLWDFCFLILFALLVLWHWLFYFEFVRSFLIFFLSNFICKVSSSVLCFHSGPIYDRIWIRAVLSYPDNWFLPKATLSFRGWIKVWCRDLAHWFLMIPSKLIFRLNTSEFLSPMFVVCLGWTFPCIWTSERFFCQIDGELICTVLVLKLQNPISLLLFWLLGFFLLLCSV